PLVPSDHPPPSIFLSPLSVLLPWGAELSVGAESVVLPCQYSGILPERNPAVIWRRYDLKPQIIHLRREDEDDLRGQHQRFSGRTSMKSDALDSLDFSLTLRKPHLSDSGTYTCIISDDREEIRVTDVQLQVKGQATAPSHREESVVRHLVRMPPGRLPDEVFWARPTRRRPTGRPRTHWRDYVSWLAWEHLKLPLEELEEVAGEREVLASLHRLLLP
uniref:Ig-like domain-containing protein n=1 Tax=Poecilia latipinna TaxID=48699 RepID=A0A3B3UK72_9TELE